MNAKIDHNSDDFVKLYTENYRPIFMYALQLTRNEASAEDLTNEAFRKAYERFDTFKKGAKFFTWAYTIVTNQYRDHLRKEKRSGVQIHSSFEGLEYVVDHMRSNPEKEAIINEKLAKLQKFIDNELDETSREVFPLYVKEYSEIKISQILGISRKAAKSRIIRARRKVHQYIAEQEMELNDK